MRPAVLQDAINSEEVAISPLYAIRYTLIYNVPGLTVDDPAIILDFLVMSDIWVYQCAHINETIYIYVFI